MHFILAFYTHSLLLCQLTDGDVSCPQWHSLSKEEQAKYYEMARKERLVHSKLYPGWSARDNYVSTAALWQLLHHHKSFISLHWWLKWLTEGIPAAHVKLMVFVSVCRVKRRRERGPRVILLLKVRLFWIFFFLVILDIFRMWPRKKDLSLSLYLDKILT